MYRASPSVSPEVSVEVAPPLGISLTVVDAVTRKPIEGARVLVDEVESFTDEVGMTVYEPLAPGTYTVRVFKSGYKSATKTVELVEVGLVLTIGLWSWWAIGLGILGGATAGTIIVAKAVEKR